MRINIYYNDILLLLDSNNLSKQNKNMLNSIENYQFYECRKILNVLQYLQKLALLNQSTVHRCLEIAVTKPVPKYSWIAPIGSFDTEIFDLLSSLNELNIKIDEKELKIILHLKRSNVERVQKVVFDLARSKLLDNDSFRIALQRITEKFPTVTASVMTKQSRKNTSSRRSELTLDNQVTIYPEPDKKSQMSGGAATVKKVYGNPDTDRPAFIIKKIGRGYLRGDNADTKEANREVKYNRFMGRQAYLYNKKKPRVVAEFIHGREVEQLTLEEIKQTSYVNRIRCLASGFFDLNIFHSHYRVFGDLSSRNFMVDLNNSTMKLIDFGSSHKMGAQHVYDTVPEFDDPNDLMNGFYRDLYGMGIVIMCFFPEIYSVKFGNRNLNARIIKTTNLTVLEQAIINFVNELMKPDVILRCTSEDALNYCTQLINNINHLTPQLLAEIERSTIKRSKTIVEDVLRGVIRKELNHLTKLLNLIKYKELAHLFIVDEKEILDKFAEQATSDDFNKLLESLLPQQQIKLLEMLGQERLIKLIDQPFKLNEPFRILSLDGQFCLIRLLGNKHLQKLTSTYSILTKLLCQLSPESRSVFMQTLGDDNVTKLFPLTSFLADAIKKLHDDNRDDIIIDLLRVFGDEPIHHIEQRGEDYDKKPISYHRFEPWQGVYDLAAWTKYFSELENLMNEGNYKHILQISNVDKTFNKTINITYNPSEGWIVISPKLPPYVIISKDTAQIAKQIFSLLSDNKEIINLATQFSIQSSYLERGDHFDIRKKQQYLADQQVLNNLSYFDPGDSNSKQVMMQKAFNANNKNLCEGLINKGVDFYTCNVDKTTSNQGVFNKDLFNSLCESQAKYNIRKLKADIFATDWGNKVTGNTITIIDDTHHRSNKVPTTVKLEFDEVIAAENGKKSYYSAWQKIIELRIEAAKHNEDLLKFSRGDAAKKHYQSAHDETPILSLRR